MSASHGPVPADGEGQVSVALPPLPIGAIAWTLSVGRDEYQRARCAESGPSLAFMTYSA
jgi:hypothetical protein